MNARPSHRRASLGGLAVSMLQARRALGWAQLMVCIAPLGCADGCGESGPPSGEAAAVASAGPRALSPEMRAKVLARVGDKEITLGQYAATLERMNEFERLRYQSADRRKLLLDEMIQVELLAEEARRRGLDKQPETRARLRQVLRDELLRDARGELPKLEAIPANEVERYYSAHQQEFQEPERRRVAHLEVIDRARGLELLEQAQKASQKEWGRLVLKYSVDQRPATALGDPEEFAGDLGIVAAPGVEDGENERVSEALRKAVFRIDKIGGVYPELVEDSGRYHIVRMIGKTEARRRSLKEAERMIRVRLLEERAKELEKKLERELRQRFEVTIDQEALGKLKVPSGFKRAP